MVEARVPRRPDRRGPMSWLVSLLRTVAVAILVVAGPALAQSHRGLDPFVIQAPQPRDPAQADVLRFLEQATFGPTEVLVAHVEKVGIAAYLEEQWNTKPSYYRTYLAMPASQAVGCPDGSEATCARDNYTMYPLQVELFLRALGSEDQLRQRVALALHEILVVSGQKVRQPSQMFGYLNMLVENAFGNYRKVLGDLTLNPAMGLYLDMVNNDAASAPANIRPNENYAREVLQLFSIGVNLLNQDGTDQLDGQGNPVATYTQETIGNFARVFTGWTYATMPGSAPLRHNPPNALAPMVLYRNAAGVDANHDKGSKQLLAYTGAVTTSLPANQDGGADLEQALDNVFRHPNVGPFLGKQLIQHLVTSNPSPGYVKRVAQAFENDGTGVRGSLKAVVQAILLDKEARGAVKSEPGYGRLREPVLFITNLCRAFNATSDGILASAATGMGQNLFNSPTVFSYYPHEYEIPFTTLEGPEFGIQSSVTAEARINAVNTLAFSTIRAPAPNPGTALNLSPLIGIAGSPTSLVEELDDILLHGTMSNAMKATVVDAVTAIAPSNPTLRAQTAFYLVASSSQYQVAR